MTEQTAIAVLSEQQIAGLAKRRFGTALATLAEENRETLYVLLRQGFNPFTDLIIYESKPFVTIDGWYNAVTRAGRRISRMPTRPVPQTERADYGLAEDEIGAVCTIYVEGNADPFANGFGKASATKPYRKNQVEAQHPYRMAEKRAEAQALRKALRAVGMSFEVGTVDSAGNVIDNIIEGTAREMPEAEPPKPAAPAADNGGGQHHDSQQAEAVARAARLKAMPMTTFGVLYAAALKEFALTRTGVLQILGVRRQEDIADLDEAWAHIVDQQLGLGPADA